MGSQFYQNIENFKKRTIFFKENQRFWNKCGPIFKKHKIFKERSDKIIKKFKISQNAQAYFSQNNLQKCTDKLIKNWKKQCTY